MNYKEKLDELMEIAVQKLNRRNKILHDMENNIGFVPYSHFDLQKADTDHKVAVGDYQRLLIEMKNKGLSESDIYIP